MSQVIVSIADQPYTMNCPDGEEDHLHDLAKLLDTEVQRIRRSVGSVGEIRLLVMSGLMVADRLSDAIRRIEELEGQHQALRDARQTAQREKADAEVLFAEKLEEAAKRLDDLSQVINQAA